MALHKPEHSKWWYWASWPFLGILYLILLPIALVQWRSPSHAGKMQWNWSLFQSLEDWLDDPVDWLKKKLFGIGSKP